MSTQATAGYQAQIDWQDDGVFDQSVNPYDDVSARVRANPAPSLARGQDQLRPLGTIVAGKASADLDNQDRVLSSGNGSSPIFAELRAGHIVNWVAWANGMGSVFAADGVDLPASVDFPDMPVDGFGPVSVLSTPVDYALPVDGYLVPVDGGYSGPSYNLWSGYLDDLVQHPELGKKSVSMPCLGPLTKLKKPVTKDPNNAGISTALYQSITTDVAINHVLDAAKYPGYSTTVLADNPVAYWRLDEGSGSTTANNVLGTANAGTITGGVTLGVAGALADSDTAMQFDGSTGYIATGVVTGMQTPAGSIEAWFKSASSSSQCIAANDTYNPPSYVNGTGLYLIGGKLMGALGSSATSFTVTSPGTVNDGAWHHAVLTWNDVAGNTTLLLYLDGTQVASATQAIAPYWNGFNFIIGLNPNGTSQVFFDGDLDEVAVYGAALSSGRIAAHYAAAAKSYRRLDVGQTVLDWWWLDNEDPLTALQVLLNSEGPGARLGEDASGNIYFQSRYYRITQSRATTSQATFNASGTEPCFSEPFGYDSGRKNVVNFCTVTQKVRSAKTADIVWSLSQTITLGANQTSTYIAKASDPFTAAVTPVAGTDFVVATGTITSVSLNRASGANVTISLTAGPAGATVNGLQLRAQPVTVDSTSNVANMIDAAASQNDYGFLPYPLQVRSEISLTTLQDFCDAIVGWWQQPRELLSLNLLASGDPARLIQAFIRDVSDRVTVVEPTTGIDGDYFVEHITHKIDLAGRNHVATFGLETAAGISDYFILDSSLLDSSAGLAW